MKSAGICAKTTKKFRICTTDSNHSLPIAENVLERDFTATKPNEKYVGDITYVKTDEGWLFLAIVIDLFSRMVVGWSMSKNMKASLVTDACQMAIDIWQPPPGAASCTAIVARSTPVASIVICSTSTASCAA